MRVHKPPSKRDIEQLKAELEVIKQRLTQIDTKLSPDALESTTNHLPLSASSIPLLES